MRFSSRLASIAWALGPKNEYKDKKKDDMVLFIINEYDKDKKKL